MNLVKIFNKNNGSMPFSARSRFLFDEKKVYPQWK